MNEREPEEIMQLTIKVNLCVQAMQNVTPLSKEPQRREASHLLPQIELNRSLDAQIELNNGSDRIKIIQDEIEEESKYSQKCIEESLGSNNSKRSHQNHQSGQNQLKSISDIEKDWEE